MYQVIHRDRGMIHAEIGKRSDPEAAIKLARWHCHRNPGWIYEVRNSKGAIATIRTDYFGKIWTDIEMHDGTLV